MRGKALRLVTATALVALTCGLAATSARSEGSAPKVALSVMAAGDSYLTGAGTQGGPTHNTTCERTPEAWPNQLASKVSGMSLVANVSCFGAHIGDIYNLYRGQTQINLLKAQQPNVLLLMIGGNDADFGGAMFRCFTLPDCTKAGHLNGSQNAVENMASKLEPLLRKLLGDLPHTHIVLGGYPLIFPTKDKPIVGCGWLADSERRLFNQLDRDLQDQEQKAVADIGSARLSFVSTLNAFAGHEMCSADSWVFAVRPTCALDDRCAHPMADGQKALAEAVAPAVQKLVRAAQPKPPKPIGPRELGPPVGSGTVNTTDANGYSARVFVNVYPPHRGNDLPPLPFSQRNYLVGCKVGPNDVVIPVAYTITNTTPGGYDPSFEVDMGLLPKSDVHYNSVGWAAESDGGDGECPNQSTGSSYMYGWLFTRLNSGMMSRQSYFIILHGIYNYGGRFHISEYRLGLQVQIGVSEAKAWPDFYYISLHD